MFSLWGGWAAVGAQEGYAEETSCCSGRVIRVARVVLDKHVVATSMRRMSDRPFTASKAEFDVGLRRAHDATGADEGLGVHLAPQDPREGYHTASVVGAGLLSDASVLTAFYAAPSRCRGGVPIQILPDALELLVAA